MWQLAPVVHIHTDICSMHEKNYRSKLTNICFPITLTHQVNVTNFKWFFLGYARFRLILNLSWNDTASLVT